MSNSIKDIDEIQNTIVIMQNYSMDLNEQEIVELKRLFKLVDSIINTAVDRNCST